MGQGTQAGTVVVIQPQDDQVLGSVVVVEFDSPNGNGRARVKIFPVVSVSEIEIVEVKPDGWQVFPVK